MLENNYFVAVFSGLFGIVLTLISQQLLNRRRLFTYFVNHGRIGVSADDAIFGSVRVTWNGNPVPNLFSSTIELINESFKDFENVVIRVFTNDSMLLTEKTEIVGTTHILYWSPAYSDQLKVTDGQAPSQEQNDLYSHQREYSIPVFNRGQVVRLHYLNAAKTQNQPTLWLDVLHKGIKIDFRVPKPEVFGLPLSTASLVGVILSLVLLGIIVTAVQTVWIAATISLFIGLGAQIPGAFAIRSWRQIKQWFGG